jgi:hypothetical protein
MLPFGVTILATVLQMLEILEGLTNYPVYKCFGLLGYKAIKPDRRLPEFERKLLPTQGLIPEDPVPIFTPQE